MKLRLILLISTGCWILSHLWPAPAALRVPVTLWFLLICPGLALTRAFWWLNVTQIWALALALSLAIDLLVSTALLYVRPGPLWSPAAVLTALTLVFTLLPAHGPQKEWAGSSP